MDYSKHVDNKGNIKDVDELLAEEAAERRRRSKDAKLLALIAEHPRLDGLGLKAVGWSTRVHGSLLDAETRGIIRYNARVGGGWEAVEDSA